MMDGNMNSLPSYTQTLVHMIFINFYASNFAPEWLKAELPEPHATLALVLYHACPEVSQETYYKRHTSGSSHYVF